MNSMNLKFVKWIPPEVKKEADAEAEDDDIDLDNSDSQFKLMALILDWHLDNKDFKNFVNDINLQQFI